MLKIGVVKEIMEGEKRVSLVPDAVEKLVKVGLEVRIQAGSGEGAMIADGEYSRAGARLMEGSEAVYGSVDVLPKVQRPVETPGLGKHEALMMRKGSVLVSFLTPQEDPELLRILAERKVTAFSMNLIPRISRAQDMDALSSQATVAGYKAVLMGAATIGRFFPMLTTAAGTIPPARVFVLGVGVAGLQAIATARRLGAVVEAFDIRPASREEVESLGARFVEVALDLEDAQDEGGYAKAVSEDTRRREQEVIGRHVGGADVVITTALVPGKRAPILVTEEMVKSMKPGSVIVDLAAVGGGNCELTEPDKTLVRYGVTIHGPLNLPSTIPYHASLMYSKNISAFLRAIIREDRLHLDLEDEVLKATCLTHGGKVLRE